MTSQELAALRSQNPIWLFQGKDVSGRDFSGASIDELAKHNFDSRTKWPDAARLPHGFDPSQVMETGLNPGLGIRALHARGVTGKGCVVAVIDKPIRPDHLEFQGHITYVEVYPDRPRTKTTHFHGAAAASILAGTRAGVAPQSHLYYMAVPDEQHRFANYTVALKKVMGINAGLTPETRIRVVSISDGYGSAELTDPEIREWDSTIRMAESQGIAAVHCGGSFPITFSVAGAPPTSDREQPESYRNWICLEGKNVSLSYLKDTLLLPGEYRATASNEDDTTYTYWGSGGRSWSCPHLAGLVALGMQVKPAAAPTELYQAIEATTVQNAQGLRLPNPEAYVASLRRCRKPEGR